MLKKVGKEDYDRTKFPVFMFVIHNMEEIL
jgi:hypothetical protein